jgi:hypothetical protein
MFQAKVPTVIDHISSEIDRPDISKSSIKRLIVLVPSRISNDIQFVRKIRSLAAINGREVLFLSIVKDIDNKLGVERNLATLAAITRTKHIQTRYATFFTRNWYEALKQIIKSGDLIICHEEQYVTHRINRKQSLKAWLTSKLSTPIISIAGFCNEENINSSKWLYPIIIWSAILITIILFSAFEISVDHMVKGWIGQVVLIMILIVEASLIWILNTIRLER